jgi:hypothetical protein
VARITTVWETLLAYLKISSALTTNRDPPGQNVTSNTANFHATVYLPCRHRPGQRDEVRVIIVGHRLMSGKIDCRMACLT